MSYEILAMYQGRFYTVVVNPSEIGKPMEDYVQVYRRRKNNQRGRRLYSTRSAFWAVWQIAKKEVV